MWYLAAAAVIKRLVTLLETHTCVNLPSQRAMLVQRQSVLGETLESDLPVDGMI